MSERRTSWLCPACGRQVPAYVEGCRCGVAVAFALPGVELEPRGPAVPGTLPRIAAALVGYAPGVGWSGGRRTATLVLFAAKLTLTFVAAYMMSSGEAAVAGEGARVLARLDEHTLRQSAAVPDTIPTFLLRPGLLGTLPAPRAEPTGPARAPVAPPPPSTRPASPVEIATEVVPLATITPLDEGELRKGFCTPTLPGLIRRRFPGSYDGMTDLELEKRVLAKYPEYRRRICELPAWIGASPHEIVKYEPITDRTAVVPVLPPCLMASLVALATAFGWLNVYYRLIAPRMTAAA